MWPDHCVSGSFGAQYHDNLVKEETDIEILRGKIRTVDS